MSDSRRLVMTRDQVAQVTGDNHQRVKEFEKLLNALSSDPVEPITTAITGNTTYTLANNRGVQTILIPESMLKASVGGPFTLTITTGLGDAVTVPIGASTDTILSGDLLFDIYIDSSGNVISKDWTIAGSNSNGYYIYSASHRLSQGGVTGVIVNSVGGTTVTYPVAFATQLTYVNYLGTANRSATAEAMNTAPSAGLTTFNVAHGYGVAQAVRWWAEGDW